MLKNTFVLLGTFLLFGASFANAGEKSATTALTKGQKPYQKSSSSIQSEHQEPSVSPDEVQPENIEPAAGAEQPKIDGSKDMLKEQIQLPRK